MNNLFLGKHHTINNNIIDFVYQFFTPIFEERYIILQGVHYILCISLKFCDFSELCQLCCNADVLPAWCVCTHTDTEGKQRNARVGNIFKNSEKKTIFNEHPVLNKFFVLCMKEYIDMQMRV